MGSTVGIKEEMHVHRHTLAHSISLQAFVWFGTLWAHEGVGRQWEDSRNDVGKPNDSFGRRSGAGRPDYGFAAVAITAARSAFSPGAPGKLAENGRGRKRVRLCALLEARAGPSPQLPSLAESFGGAGLR